MNTSNLVAGLIGQFDLLYAYHAHISILCFGRLLGPRTDQHFVARGPLFLFKSGQLRYGLISLGGGDKSGLGTCLPSCMVRL